MRRTCEFTKKFLAISFEGCALLRMRKIRDDVNDARAQPSHSRVLPWRRRNLPRTLATCVIFSLAFSYIAYRARSRGPSARFTQERRLKPLCGVITTILEVNEAVVNFVKKDRDVSLVVTGDHKTNHDEWRTFQDKYRYAVVYLSPADQQSLPFSVLRHVLAAVSSVVSSGKPYIPYVSISL